MLVVRNCFWSELPDVVTTDPDPGPGRSISRNELNPFGLVVGISLPLESKIANMNVSGPMKSGFVDAARLKLSVFPDVKANRTSLLLETVPDCALLQTAARHSFLKPT